MFGQAVWKDIKKPTLAKIKQMQPFDFASVQAGDLRTHLKTHSGEKSYDHMIIHKCKQCDFSHWQILKHPTLFTSNICLRAEETELLVTSSQRWTFLFKYYQKKTWLRHKQQITFTWILTRNVLVSIFKSEIKDNKCFSRLNEIEGKFSQSRLVWD